MYDVIIVGCGPASVQLAVRIEELSKQFNKKIEYLLIEQNSNPGSFFNTYPIHKRLISNNKLYTGKSNKSDFSNRFDWNSILMEDYDIQMRNYTTDFYPESSIIPRMLEDIVDKFNMPISFNEKVLTVSKAENHFEVSTDKQVYYTKYVVISTGFRLKKPDIKGYELVTPYNRMKHRSYYRDKSVFIIGKGNSALECAGDIMNEANMIICASPSSIHFAYQTHYVGSPRIVNSVPIENYQLKSLSAMLDCNIVGIKKDGDKLVVTVAYTHAKGEVEEIRVDEVICATGFEPNIPDIFPSISKINERWPGIDGEFMAQNIENLYFAGAITHGLDYKQYSSSGFIHGFRYNSIMLAEKMFAKLTGMSLNKEIDRQDFISCIFEILNNNSGIYLQPGFLGRHIVVNKKIYECGYLSLIAFKDMEDIQNIHLLITLEYGDIKQYMDKPLEIEREPGIPEKSLHLHPVIRIKTTDEYKEIVLEENLFNQFDKSDVNMKIIKKLRDSLII